MLCLAAWQMGCSNGTSSGPAMAFSASPSTITPGQSSTLSWVVTNTKDITGTLVLSINNGVGSVPVGTGSVVVSPAVTTTYVAMLSANGNVIGTATTTVTISGQPSPTPSSASPSVFFHDNDQGTPVTVAVTGSFAPTDTLSVSPNIWGAGSVTQSYVGPTEMDYTIPLDSAHYSPGWITLQNCHIGNTGCTTTTLAFIGNQNALGVYPSTGELYQLDQAQGLGTGQNGYVREFKPSGTSPVTLLANGSAGPTGVFFNAIAVDNYSGYVDLDGSIYSIIAGQAELKGTMTGGVASGAVNTVACSVYQANGATAGTLVCTPNMMSPPFTTASAATSAQPWSIAMVNLNLPGGGENDAIVFNRGDAALRRYAVVSSSGTTTVTQKAGVILPGVTPITGSTGSVTAGWWVVAFNSGSSPAAGKAAVLSRPDKLLVLVDLATMNVIRSITLTGDPFRIATDETNGNVIVAFADPTAGKTTFASVSMTSGNLTPLTSTTALLATGLAVSPDGKTIYACMRSDCVALKNQ